LKKAALIARRISSLGNPMLSMLATAASLSGPSARAEGSLNVLDSEEAGAAAEGAGDGVAGGFAGAAAAGAGAAGAAGVWVWVCGTGVEGAALLDDPAAGAFGY